jgi:signal transduction histidine kinase
MLRLFTKFATKSVTGTGLGLFISKSIVESQMAEYGVKIMQVGEELHFTLAYR